MQSRCPETPTMIYTQLGILLPPRPCPCLPCHHGAAPTNGQRTTCSLGVRRGDSTSSYLQGIQRRYPVVSHTCRFVREAQKTICEVARGGTRQNSPDRKPAVLAGRPVKTLFAQVPSSPCLSRRACGLALRVVSTPVIQPLTSTSQKLRLSTIQGFICVMLKQQKSITTRIM